MNGKYRMLFMAKVKKTVTVKDHRGRFQAQGKKIEESEKWSRDTPLTGVNALKLLSKLQNKIPTKESDIRAKAFEQAKNDINRCMAVKGISAFYPKSFLVSGTRHERVDIEVWAGKAFG